MSRRLVYRRLLSASAVPSLVMLAAGGGFAGVANAQDAPNVTPGLVPTFSAGADYLESRGRTNGANGREGIVRVSPGLQYGARTGALRGAIDYTASFSERAGVAATAGGDLQNSLNANFVVDAVPNVAFVDLRASVSQQAISAFGQQFAEGSALPDNNRSEVRTLTLSPALRGALGGVAQIDARANAGWTRSSNVQGANSSTTGGSLGLKSTNRGGLVDASIDWTTQQIRYETQPAVRNDRLVAGVSITPDAAIQLRLRGGRESLQVSSAGDIRRTPTYGGSLQWTPTPRSSWLVDADERYFGRSGRISVSQRFPRTAFSYTAARDVTNGADGTSVTQPMTQAQLLSLQLSSSIPDDAQRAAAVQAILAANGIDPNQTVSITVQSDRLSIQERHDLSASWSGQRISLNVFGFRSTLRALTFVEGLQPIAGEPVVQHGYSASAAYQLTPTASIRVNGSRTMTFGTTSLPGNDLKSAGLSWTNQVGRRTSVSVGARYSVFNSATDPYRETSMSASLNLRF